uniref:Secreted protein n=1 Tax=Steinernema glaseri TaxID=37863 RepID=A0A1I7ZYZ8_9BILA
MQLMCPLSILLPTISTLGSTGTSVSTTSFQTQHAHPNGQLELFQHQELQTCVKNDTMVVSGPSAKQTQSAITSPNT